jgi:uncharacterized damage-inducible protein DinB
MNNELTAGYAKLDDYTSSVLNSLSTINQEILQDKPAESVWSVMQILDHLVLAEAMSLGYLEKKINGIEEVGTVGVRSRLGMLLIKLLMNGGRKFKAPKSVSQPDGQVTLDQVGRKWKEERQRLFTFLENYPDEHLDKAIYKHPVIGRISLVQMLAFFVVHIKHHEVQIKQRLKNANA